MEESKPARRIARFVCVCLVALALMWAGSMDRFPREFWYCADADRICREPDGREYVGCRLSGAATTITCSMVISGEYLHVPAPELRDVPALPIDAGDGTRLTGDAGPCDWYTMLPVRNTGDVVETRSGKWARYERRSQAAELLGFQ